MEAIDESTNVAETSGEVNTDEETIPITSTSGGWELCEILFDSEDLRELGIPQGTQVVRIRIKGGVILVSPAC
jgi:hypothetical protein